MKITTDIIDKCIQWNVLVFDDEAPTEHVTKKLVYNIIRQCPNFTHLYIPKMAYVYFAPDHWTGFDEPIKIFNRLLVFDDTLNIMKEYYLQRGGSLVGNDIHLLLATVNQGIQDETNTVIASC